MLVVRRRTGLGDRPTEWAKLEAVAVANAGTTFAYVYVVPELGCVLVDDVALTLE